LCIIIAVIFVVIVVRKRKNDKKYENKSTDIKFEVPKNNESDNQYSSAVDVQSKLSSSQYASSVEVSDKVTYDKFNELELQKPNYASIHELKE